MVIFITLWWYLPLIINDILCQVKSQKAKNALYNQRREYLVKHWLISIMLLAIALCTAAYAGELTQYHTKIIVHSTKLISTVGDTPVKSDSTWQLTSWVITPDVGHGPIFMMAGLHYQRTNWWLEAITGPKIQNGEGEWTIDVRGSYDGFKPIHCWSNAEYYVNTHNWYWYADANLEIGTLGLLGVESENCLNRHATDDWSIGPRVVLPFHDNRFILIGAYQFHGGADQVWARMLLNF